LGKGYYSALNQQKRKAIFERLRSQDPHPRTELVYSNSFELLVAVILSAQATDVSVNKATARLFKSINSPKAMLEVGEEGLKQYIKNIGLYNTKATYLIETCNVLLERHGGEVPRDRASLEALSGVGRKTANVILNTAFGIPTIAVDTHIFRVANRTKLAPGKRVRTVERRLMRLVPNEYKKDAHHWLILHGRYVCTARKPRCHTCIIFDLCEWRSKPLDQQRVETG
jgi:endonuclease III